MTRYTRTRGNNQDDEPASRQRSDAVTRVAQEPDRSSASKDTFRRVDVGARGVLSRLGSLGFGGPAALAAITEDDLVERRKWLTRDRYLEGLATCQTLPGPLAIQVGIYVGYICRGVLGAWMAGGAFILSPFAIVLAYAYLYERFSALTLVRALFYGISPVVIALIVHSCYTLGKIALKDRWLWGICGVVAIVTALLQAEIALLFIGAGIFGVVLYGGAQAVGFRSIGIHTRSRGEHGGRQSRAAKPAAVLRQGRLVHIWQRPRDRAVLAAGCGLTAALAQRARLHGSRAIGMITPGPVVITATFVGYVVAGVAGSLVATVGIFLPSFVLVTVVAPQLVRHREKAYVQGFVKAVSAAAIGAILGASVVLARLAIGDTFSAAVAFVSAVALFRWHVAPPILVAISAVAGLLAFAWIRPAWVMVR